MRKTRTVGKLLIFCLLLVVLWPAASAYAYNGDGAAAYGESWAKAHNSAFPNLSDSGDCTNFTSQCLNWGGGVHEKYGSTEDTKWYCDKGLLGFSWSKSWAVASYFYSFLRYYGSPIQGTWKTPSFDASTLINSGDILFYTWDSEGPKDHAGICTAYATDPDSGITGDVQCQHTSDRYRAIWHLRPYNRNWTTTTITVVRPSSTL